MTKGREKHWYTKLADNGKAAVKNFGNAVDSQGVGLSEWIKLITIACQLAGAVVTCVGKSKVRKA